MELKTGTLRSLVYPRDVRSRRVSSWDRSGGNADGITIPRGETVRLAEIEGSGCISHNCFFPMPFSTAARVEIENQCDCEVGAFYYYIDTEAYSAPKEDLLRFHAQWRRENPTQGTADMHTATREELLELTNIGGQENYVILDAAGRGHYVGCNLSIDHINPWPGVTWFGEGDDMIFIDGEEWPPF